MASTERTAALGASATPRSRRLPTARTLARFLSQAQAAVRLRGEVTVLLTTDTAIRKLNRRFRGKNTATDVLSFPADGIGAEAIAGDLAISVPTALKQAVEQNHSLSTEIKVLILHGLLHLAGHDHEVDEGKMARRERQFRVKLNLPQGLIERNATKPTVNSSTNAPCPILSRTLQKGGIPRTAAGLGLDFETWESTNLNPPPGAKP
jgi:probable rRNA maturation factor